jgi:hypothetical protein
MSHITGKTSNHLKKASISLKMYLKGSPSIKKASHLLEKASISMKMPSERI